MCENHQDDIRVRMLPMTCMHAPFTEVKTMMRGIMMTSMPSC